MIAVNRSSRIDQLVSRWPDCTQSMMWICCMVPSWPINTIQLSKQDRNSSAVVRTCAPLSPMMRQPKPAMMAPTSGANRIIFSMASALHHVDVFDRDRPAVAEEADEDCKPDRGLGRGDRQHQQRENLSGEIARIAGESDQIDI